jgi:16S rRNA (uracil1498-N3)-methyltransferase
MSNKSIYIPEPLIESGVLRVAGQEHQHLRVARARTGEAVEVFDGKGGVWNATVDCVDKREAVLRILESRRDDKPGPELILGLSLVKSAAFELALEKVVEVGVTRVIPIIAGRSNVVPGRRADRWARIVIEAAKQSKRYHLPAIDEPRRFEAALALPASTKIVFAERGGGPLKSALAGSPAIFLIGPEGGWTDEELESARNKGFALVGLGEGILRTETAAIVGAALIRYELHRTA